MAKATITISDIDNPPEGAFAVQVDVDLDSINASETWIEDPTPAQKIAIRALDILTEEMIRGSGGTLHMVPKSGGVLDISSEDLTESLTDDLEE